MEQTISVTYSPDEFTDLLKGVITEAFANIQQPSETPVELLSRKDTAKLLGISLPTLTDWTNRGLIIGYRIGTRKLYKRHEIIESLEQVRSTKHKRLVTV